MTRSIDDFFETFSNYEEQIAKDCFVPSKVVSLEKMQELMDSLKPIPKVTLYLSPDDARNLRASDRLAFSLGMVREPSLFADMYGGVPVFTLPPGADSFMVTGDSFKQFPSPFEWNCRCVAVPIPANPIDDIPSVNDLLLTMIVVGISIAWGLHLWFAMAGGP